MKNPVEVYYDRFSKEYDLASSGDLVWTPPIFASKKLKRYLFPALELLEIGIGTGQFAMELSSQGFDINITGIDISSEMLKICADKIRNSKLIHGDIEKIDFKSKKRFDIVAIIGSLEFMEDIDVVLEKCTRLLASDGVLAFTFEPFIEFHPIQQYRKSLTTRSTNNEYFVNNFLTFRRSSIEINNLLNKHKLKCVDQHEFVAYKKFGEDIIYHLLIVKLKEQT